MMITFYGLRFAKRTLMKHIRLRHGPTKIVALVYVGICAAILLGACGENMRNDGRIKVYEPSAGFASGVSQQPIDPNTVARGQAADVALATGKDAGGNPVASFPITIDAATLARGKQRFTIYCVPCHGEQGDGKGLITNFGMPAPPSYQTDALRTAPVGHFFDVITNGKGKMLSYASRVPVLDRWAIAAYIRALQISPQAPLEVPPEQIK
jgi:mono/diheme cytochrome c family protein